MTDDGIAEVRLRQQNVALVQRYLDAWSVLDISAVEATLHTHIELELGYAPPDVTDIITGKGAVMEFMAAVPTLIAPMNFHDISISTLEDSAELVAEYRGDSRALTTDRPYRNRYISRVRVQDGLIRRYLEYSDPRIFVEAFQTGAADDHASAVGLNAADRIAIHELLARRAHAADFGDVEAWVGTFTDNAVLEQPEVVLDLPGGASKMQASVDGGDQLRAFISASLPNIVGMRHWIGNVITEAAEQGAVARSIFNVVDTGRAGATVVSGRYTDVLERIGPDWRTSRLTVEMDVAPTA